MSRHFARRVLLAMRRHQAVAVHKRDNGTYFISSVKPIIDWMPFADVCLIVRVTGRHKPNVELLRWF